MLYLISVLKMMIIGELLDGHGEIGFILNLIQMVMYLGEESLRRKAKRLWCTGIILVRRRLYLIR